MDVLIVEDDPQLRRVLALVLSDEGYAVETAGHGKEALAKVQEQRPGLILLDLWMPVMNGWELLAELHQLPQGERLPVIILTANHRALPRSPSASIYLKKPVDVDILLTAVRETLESAAGTS